MKYEIERKGPSDPSYVKVGDMTPSAGNILAPHSYQFSNDLTSGSSGLYSYRIRQIIDTNAATFTAIYIDTATVILSSPCVVTGIPNPDPNKILVTVQPNPATGDNATTLVVETPYAIPQMHIVIFDSKGDLIRQQKDSKGTGKKIFDVAIDRLSKGKYYIRVFNGGKLVGTAEFLRL